MGAARSSGGRAEGQGSGVAGGAPDPSFVGSPPFYARSMDSGRVRAGRVGESVQRAGRVAKRQPNKLTPEALKAITRAIADGAPRYIAAEAAGVDPATLRRWMADGRKPGADADRRALCAAIKKAEAVFVTSHARIVATAAKRTWQAACWLLERRVPEEFASDRREIAALVRRVAELEREREELRGLAGQDQPPGRSP